MSTDLAHARDWVERHVTEGKWYPSETLVRMLRGGYVEPPPGGWEGKRALEVGCGNGNNLEFLKRLGLETCGTETSDTLAHAVAATKGVDVRTGANRSLPFEDAHFDLLVSWNVLHYEPDHKNLRRALREYHRVLGPGGRALISTTGPGHKILRGAEWLGDGRVKLSTDDFRDGDVHCVFRDDHKLASAFTGIFPDVQVGREWVELFDGMLDWWLVVARKGEA